MSTYLNRGATYTKEPQLPDDPLIDLLAQTNARVEHFDLSPNGHTGSPSCRTAQVTPTSSAWTYGLPP